MNKGNLIRLTEEIQSMLREISHDSDDMSVCLDADALRCLVCSLQIKIQFSKEIEE